MLLQLYEKPVSLLCGKCLGADLIRGRAFRCYTNCSVSDPVCHFTAIQPLFEAFLRPKLLVRILSMITSSVARSLSFRAIRSASTWRK